MAHSSSKKRVSTPPRVGVLALDALDDVLAEDDLAGGEDLGLEAGGRRRPRRTTSRRRCGGARRPCPSRSGTRLPSRPSRSSGPSTRCTGMRGSVIGRWAPAWMSLNSTLRTDPTAETMTPWCRSTMRANWRSSSTSFVPGSTRIMNRRPWRTSRYESLSTLLLRGPPQGRLHPRLDGVVEGAAVAHRHERARDAVPRAAPPRSARGSGARTASSRSTRSGSRAGRPARPAP